MTRLLVGHVALGYDDAGSGTAVVLVHGFTLDRRMWDDQAPPLLAAGYRVLRYDLRGHGESDAPPTGYSYSDHAEDLMRLCDLLGVASAHVVGLSLGGGVAATFAQQHPQRVRSLTLIDAVLPGLPSGNEMSAILRGMRERALAGDLPGALHEQWAQSRLMYPTKDDPALAARLRAMMERFSPVQFYDRAAPPAGPTVADRLPEVHAPALVLVGELDMADFHSFARTYAERLPDARLQIVPGAGHMANMDQPEAVNNALLAFLRHVDGAV